MEETIPEQNYGETAKKDRLKKLKYEREFRYLHAKFEQLHADYRADCQLRGNFLGYFSCGRGDVEFGIKRATIFNKIIIFGRGYLRQFFGEGKVDYNDR